MKINYTDRINLFITIALDFVPEIMSHACNHFPQLKNAKRIAMADFFGIIVLLDTAKRAIDTDIAESERDFVRKMLISKVQQWNPSAEHALGDLERLRNTMACQLTTKDLPKDFFTGVAGAWITWNLTDKEPILDERAIMSLLGKALVDGLGTDRLWLMDVS